MKIKILLKEYFTRSTKKTLHTITTALSLELRKAVKSIYNLNLNKYNITYIVGWKVNHECPFFIISYI